MFVSHEHSGCNCIELYITLQPCIPSQKSQITSQDESGEFDPQWSDDVNPEVEAEVDVVDEKEEETEIQVDHMLNNDDEDDDQPPPIPPSHVYNPPQHMTNMDLHDDETSNSVFYNPYPRSEGELKVGDMFRTKEECVLAIKKFHMNNSADFTVKRIDSRR